MSKNWVTYIHRTVYKHVKKRVKLYLNGQSTQHLDIYLLLFWTFFINHLDTHITIWIDILQFRYIYCHLDINVETRHTYITFQHFDSV